MIWVSPGFKGPLSREVWDVLRHMERNAGEDIYITHGQDGRHGNGTRHYQGDAVDILPLKKTKIEIYKARFMGTHDILDERSHWHIEYDPK